MTEPNPERLDIEACEENLDYYASAGDARSCRDIGLALARELTTTRERADVLEDFAGWLAAQGPVPPAGQMPDGSHTAAEWLLSRAIDRARKALSKEG